MVAPLILAGAGLAGAGLAGSLFGNKNAPSVNYQPLIDQINASKQKQTDIASALPGQIQQNSNTYTAGINNALTNYQNSANTTAKNFLSSIGSATDSQGKQLSDVLAQRVLSTTPQQQQALREGLAATGGLQRGAANKAFTDLATTQAQQIGQGQEAIVAQQNQARINALNTVQNMDESVIQNTLGVTKDQLLQVYNSGNQALINEANQLLGIEQTANNDLLGVTAGQINANLAQQQQNNAQQQALYNALLNSGTTLLGYGLQSPKVAANSTNPITPGAV